MDQISKLLLKGLLMREPIKAENEQSIRLKPDELDGVLSDEKNIVIEMSEEEGILIRFTTKEEDDFQKTKEKREQIRKQIVI